MVAVSAGSDEVVVSRPAGLSGAARDQFVRIYEASFPASERTEPESLLASIEAGERLCLVAEHASEVAGLAVLLPMLAGEVHFLEYLAVDPSRRSLGIGARLLHRLAALPRAGVVFEVEPVEGADGDEGELRRRRVAFYERHGAVRVACAPDYRAPRLDEDGDLPFTLMWLPAAGRSAELGGDLLRAAVREILLSSYELDEAEPLVESNLRALRC
jgi:GNAT superfamily N-acetyltransferase